MTALFQIIVYVPEVERAAAFWERAFGLRRGFTDPEGHYASMATGDTLLAFASQEFVRGNGLAFKAIDPFDDPPGVEVNLVVDDVRATFDRAVEAGAAPWFEPAEQPWGQTVAYVRDPVGLLVEIASPPPMAAGSSDD